ncbi:glycosyltransferase family 2 protein [Paenibacillus sp. CF384]|uniref:glycosyltransferase family 2 protein n=1 Tax=Paenibacillus sp. CF384 TaxID=1884382 RepID=UPI000894399D|nr:hypothetical protein [Paenibacillus sp. CF384]SDW82030.1 hypothetical protein SAMN05518855_1005239 [Paenibacillus sp. CF384]
MQSRKSGRSGKRASTKTRTHRSRAGRTGQERAAGSYTGKLRTAYNAGYTDGALLRKNGYTSQSGTTEAKLRMNERWTTRCAGRNHTDALRVKLLSEGRAYADGFAAALNLPRGMWQPIAMGKSVAAVVLSVPGMNPSAINQLLRLPLQEVIVVLEGGSEGEFAELRAVPEITIMQIGESLGADVGRAIGARMTRSDIVLFADGQSIIAAEQLALMLSVAETGADIVVADQTPSLGIFKTWDEAARVRAFMNWSLGRAELLANSVELLPHAWSRHGMETVGVSTLAVPPMAHMAAIQHKLMVRSCSLSKVRKNKTVAIRGPVGVVSKELSLGDHVEALQTAMRSRGPRLAFPDQVRRRAAAGGTAT